MADENNEALRSDGRNRWHVSRVLWIWAILSVIVIVIVLIVVPLIERASGSPSAHFASLTDVVFTALAVPVALFVWVFMFYSLVVFRDRRSAGAVENAEDLPDGPHIEAKPRHQILWLAVTAALAAFTVAWGMFGFYQQTTAKAHSTPLVVNVTGQEWTWTFGYPRLGVKSHELVLPVGHEVQFRVTSDDVLHGFSIGQLGVSMDANPGVWVATPVIKPTRLGTYEVRCNELCGLYHTYMWAQVKVVPMATFIQWVKANGGNSKIAGSPGGGGQAALSPGNELEEAV